MNKNSKSIYDIRPLPEPDTATMSDELALIWSRCRSGMPLGNACIGTSYISRVPWARYELECHFDPLRFDEDGGFVWPPLTPTSPQLCREAEERFTRELARCGHDMSAILRAVVRYYNAVAGALPPEYPGYTPRQEQQDIFEYLFVPRGWKVDAEGFIVSPFPRSAAQRRIDRIHGHLYDPHDEPDAFARVRALVAAQGCGRRNSGGNGA